MLDGPSVAQALTNSGVTDVVWVPDSEIGAWEPALCQSSMRLIRVAREGEAIALAGGLLIGGQQPIVLIQCTGLFEAGDSLRNIIHDLKLPLFLIVGLRGQLAHRQGKTMDTCPRFSEPIVQAWQVPYVILDQNSPPADIAAEFERARNEKRAGAVLLAE